MGIYDVSMVFENLNSDFYLDITHVFILFAVLWGAGQDLFAASYFGNH